MPQYPQCRDGSQHIIVSAVLTEAVKQVENELVGDFNPSEKYESQLGLLFPIYGFQKHVSNHQPVKLCQVWQGQVMPSVNQLCCRARFLQCARTNSALAALALAFSQVQSW
jgi:hypothetical protein